MTNNHKSQSSVADPITDPVLIVTAETTIKIDISGWLLGDYEDWVNAARQADLTTMRKTLARVVTDWPFEGDPHDDAAWRNLRPQDFKHVMEAMSSMTAAIFQ